jgi:methanogenic corrinoid protein MtbC1
MFTIKHAAVLTGVPETTLRAWERRYGVVEPHRTEAGYRLYDGRQLDVLTRMRDLVGQGWSPREAATEACSAVERGLGAPAGTPDRMTAPGTGAPVAPATSPGLPMPPGTVAPSGWPDLVAAGESLDPDLARRILDEAFARGTYEAVVHGWLLPMLMAVGEAWADGRVTVAGEHLVSSAVHRRLAAAFEAAGGSVRGAPRVVVGLPPGARHELGLLAFATAARRAGLAVTYLGADLPAREWVAAARSRGARATVLAVPRQDDVHEARRVVASLHRRLPETLVAVGGARQDRMPASCVRLGHDVVTAASELVRLLEE